MNTLHESTGYGIAHHVVSCKNGFVSKNPESMLDVLAQCNHLQVLKPVIGLDPIFVVDRHLGWNPDECFGHHSMGISITFSAIHAKDMLFVSIAEIDIADDDSRLQTLNTHDAPYPSFIADFVNRQVLNDSPLFHTGNLTTEYR